MVLVDISASRVVSCVLSCSYGIYSTCIYVWEQLFGSSVGAEAASCVLQSTNCACNVSAALDQHGTHTVGIDAFVEPRCLWLMGVFLCCWYA